MTRSQQPAFTLFAVGMIGHGILALVYGDFALVWQPSPHGSQAGRFSPMLRASSRYSAVLACF